MSAIKVIKRDGTIVDYDRSKIKSSPSKRPTPRCPEEDRIQEARIDSIIDQHRGPASASACWWRTSRTWWSRPWWRRTSSTWPRPTSSTAIPGPWCARPNTTDESILSLLRNENKELAEENSNKNTMIAATQRDYIAGEVSRDLTRRILLPEYISKAHDEGAIHFHDADYFIQPIFNCCLINIGDMLDNGTVMNGKLIESPKSFQVACTVMTQIIACVASNQYGGQSRGYEPPGQVPAPQPGEVQKAHHL